MGKTAKTIILFGLVIMLGFLRDYMFYNINWVYKTLTQNRRLQARDEFHFLLNWEATDILALKWILTVLFFFLFGLFTWLVIRVAFENKLYNKISLFIFIGLLIISGILFIIYKLIGSPPSLYGVIRALMGLGQSFIPLLFLYITFKFFPNSSKIGEEY